jgi:DivIVA domain-containing protein
MVNVEGSLSADLIAQQNFGAARRGFDPEEVRAFLVKVAAEIVALHERQAALEDARRDAEYRAAHPSFDEETLLGAVGDETAQILKSAHEAAGDIRSRAEENASRILKEGHHQAEALRAEAETVLARRTEEAEAMAARIKEAARAESERLVDQARQQSKAIRAQSEAERNAMIEGAQATREKILSALTKKRNVAVAQVEQLRAGRERLLEAYQVVRRTLDEATVELARAEAEARAAADAIRHRPLALDEPDGLDDESDPTNPTMPIVQRRLRPARPVADAGSPPPPSAAVATRPTTSVSVPAGTSPAAPAEVIAPAPSSGSGAPRPRPSAADSPPPGPRGDSPPPGPRGDSSPSVRNHADAPPPSRPDAGSQPVASSDAHGARGSDVQAAIPSGAPVATGPGVTPLPTIAAAGDLSDAAPPPPSNPGVQPTEPPSQAAPDSYVSPSERMTSPSDTHAATTTEVEPAASESAAMATAAPAGPAAATGDLPISAPAATDVPAAPRRDAMGDGRPAVTSLPFSPSDTVESLFARIRADRDKVVAHAREVLAEDRPVPDGDEAMLQRRDEVVGPVEANLTRRLKRALQDDQNDLLDRLRGLRSSQKAAAVVLAAPEAHAARFREAGRPFLAEAMSAGRAFTALLLPGIRPAEHLGGLEQAADELAEAIVEPLRRRLEGVLAAGEGDDPVVLAEAVGGAYREWKTKRVEVVAADHVAAAFAAGAYAATPSGTALRWLVEDVDGPCPDCDDNVLAGAQPKGEPFPTGQRHPPAHPGCRCLLIPQPD